MEWRHDMEPGVYAVDCRGCGLPKRESVRIVCPKPRTPSELSTLLHELGHVALRHTKRDQGWRCELQAWEWALRWWDDIPALPGRAEAVWHAAARLDSYLGLAVEDGLTSEEIDQAVPGELVAYRPRLEAGERSYRAEQRRQRGEFIARTDPTPQVWNPWG